MNKSLQQKGRRLFLSGGIPLAIASWFGVVSTKPTAVHTGSNLKTVASLTALRKQTIPLGSDPVSIIVLGFSAIGDGGGGTFFWDPGYVSQNGIADDGGTFLLPAGHPASAPGRWRRLFSGAVNPKWFGALGDNTGRTPQEDKVVISSAPWNKWPYWTRTRDFSPIFLGFDLQTAPFQETDSWDSIGLQLALFSIGEKSGEVAVPAGYYQLTFPLFYTNGMRATFSGAGMYQTIVTKKKNHFDSSAILDLYRIGGVPTIIRDLCFSGPFGGGTKNFTLIRQQNTNGVHLENCWLTVCQIGVSYTYKCSDSYIVNCTAEFCETVLSVEESELFVDRNNFWQSATQVRYTGIESTGQLHCVGNRFVGFEGLSINSRQGVLHAADNHFSGFSGANGVIFTAIADSATKIGEGAVISGNRIVGGTIGAMVDVGAATVVTGNYMEQTGSHACLNLRPNASLSNISGNILRSHPDKKIAEGGLLVSLEKGCTRCLITSNVSNMAGGIIVDPAKNTISNNLEGE